MVTLNIDRAGGLWEITREGKIVCGCESNEDIEAFLYENRYRKGWYTIVWTPPWNDPKERAVFSDDYSSKPAARPDPVT